MKRPLEIKINGQPIPLEEVCPDCGGDDVFRNMMTFCCQNPKCFRGFVLTESGMAIITLLDCWKDAGNYKERSVENSWVEFPAK